MTTAADIPLHELPDWMRQARRGVDWGIALVLAFSLAIAIPFLTQPNLPHTNASENYVYRTADYAEALREGRLYPRWSSNALYGYGAPIPHYLPPGAAYSAAVLQVLFTDDSVFAVRLIFTISLCIAGIMTYGLVSRRNGARAGLLASILYVYSPFVGLTAPHLLGDLSGVVAFALMPTLLWSVDRCLHYQLPANMLFLSVSTAGLYLTNPFAAITSSIMALGLVLWHQRTIRRATGLTLLAGYAIGLGMAGFYWIPMLLEQSAIYWRSPEITTRFRLTLQELLTPLHHIDSSELIPSPQFTLGIPLIIFTLLAIASAIRFRHMRPFQTLFLIEGLVLIAAAVIVFPGEVWLLGAISLCLAIGSSLILEWSTFIPPQPRRLILPALLILTWFLNVPVWLPPNVHEPFGSTDGKTQLQHELQGYGVAVVPPTSAVPVTMPNNFLPDRLLVEGYQSNNINKIPPGQVSTNGQIGVLEHNTHSDRFQIHTRTPVTVDVLTAYFPGWRASLSNNPVPLRRNPTTGLMQVDLPIEQAGELLITLGTTELRLGAWLIAAACGLMVLVITWGNYQRYKSVYIEQERLGEADLRLLALVAGCLGITILLFNNPNFPLSLRPKAGYKLHNSAIIQNRTDSGLNLLAFRLPRNAYRPGETVNLDLYWQAQRFLSENYRAEVYLTNNRDGTRWSATPLRHPGNYPTRRWRTGFYVTDNYQLTLPADIPTGNYQINVRLYTCNPDCQTGTQVTFFNIDGQLLGSTLTLPTLIAVGE
jgi:hypothetical protein